MPKWLSSMLIVVGFMALIVLAILPRNFELTVTTNVNAQTTAYADSLHAAPPDASDDDKDDGGQ